jgi:hypothetical protein
LGKFGMSTDNFKFTPVRLVQFFLLLLDWLIDVYLIFLGGYQSERIRRLLYVISAVNPHQKKVEISTWTYLSTFLSLTKMHECKISRWSVSKKKKNEWKKELLMLFDFNILHVELDELMGCSWKVGSLR